MDAFAQARTRPKKPRAGGTIRPHGSTESRGLQKRWRRRESNPRPQSHREERLQACPALEFRPAAGSQATYRRASHPLRVPPRAIGSPLAASPLVDAGIPIHGPRSEPTRYLIRQRVRGSYPHLRCSRLFYEADRGPRLAALPENRPRRNQVAPRRRIIACAPSGPARSGDARLARRGRGACPGPPSPSRAPARS
jgi:hypothetical protein